MRAISGPSQHHRIVLLPHVPEARTPEPLAEQVCERRERTGPDWLIIGDAVIDRFPADVLSRLT